MGISGVKPVHALCRLRVSCLAAVCHADQALSLAAWKRQGAALLVQVQDEESFKPVCCLAEPDLLLPFYAGRVHNTWFIYSNEPCLR